MLDLLHGIPLSSNTAAGHFLADTGYGVFGYSKADNGGVFENNSDSWFVLYAQADSAKRFPFEVENSRSGGYMCLDAQGNLFVSGTVTANGTVLSAPTVHLARSHAAVPPGHVPLGAPTAGLSGPASPGAWDGNVTTDGHGFATVRLPAIFQSVYHDPRYQLTAEGSRGWDATVGV